MKRLLYRLVAIVMVIALQFTLLAAAQATTITKNGLQIEFSTDKQSYSNGDTIKFEIDLVNNSEQELTFTYDVIMPEDIATSASEKGVLVVGSEETISTKGASYVTNQAADAVPSTGDSFPLMLAGALFLAAGVVCFVLAKNKKRFITFMMLFVLFFGMVEPMLTAPAYAQENNNEIWLDDEATLENEAYEEDAYQEDYEDEIPEAESERIWAEEERAYSANLDPVMEMVDEFTESFSFKHQFYMNNQLKTVTVNATITNDTVREDTIQEKATLTAPTVSISHSDTSKFRIKWNKISGATHYEVYHKNSDGKYVRKNTTTKLYCDITSAYKGVVNTYKVRAVKKSGTKILLTSPYTTKTCFGMNKPKSVTVKHTSSTSENVRISWTAGSKCTGYKIYYSRTKDGTYKLLGSTTATSYVDKKYNGYYRIRPYYTKSDVTYLGPSTTEVAMKRQCRALIIGQTYSSWSSNRLPSCENDARGMKKMLSSMTSPNYRAIDVKLYLNRTASQMRSLINTNFTRAKDTDISLFYYTGHGVQATGTDFHGALCGIGADDSSDYLTVDELRKALDTVPGKKIVIFDSCYSGQFINKSMDGNMIMLTDKEAADAFNDSVIEVFSAPGADGLLEKGNLAAASYYVLTSSSKTQTSLCYNGSDGYGLFTYGLLLGSGYDISTGSFMPSMYADTNNNGMLTLNELYSYSYKTVNSILSSSTSKQSVRVYPNSSSFVCWGK